MPPPTRRALIPACICLAAFASFTNAATPTVETHRMTEVTFVSTKSYADPFNEVTLDVVFSSPNNRSLRVPAFWAGGNTWRVRYASGLTGTHPYRTVCSDTQNATLHDITGKILITPYTGTNPLFLHGPLRIADDHRHFSHADGTPFFWLGDTWWMGLSKRLTWPDDFQQLAANRRNKGFTVIQIVAGLFPDSPAFDQRAEGDAGLPWEPNYPHIRPEYFDAADRRILHLVEQGMMPCILGGWGYHLPWLGTEKMKQHWRYIIARWGALPVVWCASGEQAMPWYLSSNKPAETQQLRREWTEVIRSIRATDPFKRLITTHPRSNARDEVLDPTLLDFEMQQTGHGSPTEHHAAMAIEAWNRPPTMPVVCGESRYEALEIKPMLHARDAREAFWAHLLNSGCAGHTYGVNGVWQVNLTDKPFGKSPSGRNWGNTPWQTAMNLPGSTQLSYAKKFLLTLPWNQLSPTSSIFTGATSAATTPSGNCALAYAAKGQTLIANLGKFTAPVAARWFDPTRGVLSDIQGTPFSNNDSREFSPPGKNADGDADWVLVLEGK